MVSKESGTELSATYTEFESAKLQVLGGRSVVRKMGGSV